MLRALAAVFLGALSTFALGEVIEATPAGFLVRFEVVVNATPDKAYSTMTGEVGNWWNMDHSYSRDGKNLTIDARAGGCFCEKLPSGGSVQHMSVVFASPGSMLRMLGGLGPLQGGGIAGSMSWRFIAAPPGTKIEVSYSVGGYFQGGLDKIAAPVNAVLGEQVTRLKSYIDTGKPTAS
jgi:hypothetical protein